ncbi:MAG TPA: tRNA (5-methylaminomethyl-2-thiouridine)(34)-methyltransferase MnmD [Paludibacter sp.]|nr:tRNA (5-methylaminomethyl-2-thiouridine)(34)-methyltransferase MnmD [Paludibacter sp.]
MNSELQITGDGSHTLFVPGIAECYHSTHGAVQESKHIFIDAGLKHCTKQEIRVLEVGFGTGLNAFLTMLEAETSRKTIRYTAFEKFPVELEKAIQLNYPEMIAPGKQDYFNRLHRAEWNVPVGLTPFLTIEKMEVDFTATAINGKYDVVYFDAFSPEKQPEMWSGQLFERLFSSCNPGAVLTTYCAKGMVRRAMQAAGFRVERLPGPPGKREILRGVVDLKI